MTKGVWKKIGDFDGLLAHAPEDSIVIFKCGKQREFLKYVMEKANLDVYDLSITLEVNVDRVKELLKEKDYMTVREFKRLIPFDPRLRVEKLFEKYSIDIKPKTWKHALTSVKIAGYVRAEDRMTLQEVELLDELRSSREEMFAEIHWKVHEPVKIGNIIRNVDFAYYDKSGHLIAIEEAVSELNHRILPKLVKRAKELRQESPRTKLIVTVKKLGDHGRLAAHILIKHGILLNLDREHYQIANCLSRNEMLRCIILDDIEMLKKHVSELDNWLKLDENTRNILLKASKTREYAKLSEIETMVHEELEKQGFNPEGKVMVIEHDYGIIVPDNVFKYENETWFTFVSKASTVRGLYHRLEDLAGYSCLTKEIIPNAKTLAIIVSDLKDTDVSKIVDGMSEKAEIARTFIDLLIDQNDLKSLRRILMKLRKFQLPH